MSDQLIRLKEVSSKFCIPTSTIWYWIKKEKFPKPIKLGERFIAWRESDLNAWLDAKQGDRDCKQQNDV
jgi:prophage regulatory protein